jgi:hypothetical protein
MIRFKMGTKRVYCAIRNEYLNMNQINFILNMYHPLCISKTRNNKILYTTFYYSNLKSYLFRLYEEIIKFLLFNV